MAIDIPTRVDYAELTQHRHPASVTLYVGTAGSGQVDPTIGQAQEATQVALRTAAADAVQQLAKAEVDVGDRDRITKAVEELEEDREFWRTSARTVAVFVSPEGLRAFRLMNALPSQTDVSDRFHTGPLIRATTFAHAGYVLAVTPAEVRLLRLEPDATFRPIELTTLPGDAGTELQAPNTDGRMDRHKADGTLGPKVEQRHFCSTVQDAVLAEINGSTRPMVLAAATELDRAYRAVNSYRGLLEEGIDTHPASLSLMDLEQRGREVLDRHYATGLREWRERFGTLQAHGRASSEPEQIARAASSGQVDVLLLDLASTREGTIDEFGAITLADEPGPSTYGLADEIAARVLRTGGTVKAVRSQDLPPGAVLAATFRAEVNG